MRTHDLALMQGPITWILVADGRRADVYARHKAAARNSARSPSQPYAEAELIPIAGMSWRLSRDEASEEIITSVIRDMAGQLEKASFHDLFDRLVLIAPPKMLSEIKNHLHSHVLGQIAAELPKELTHYSKGSLSDKLGEIL